MSDLTARQRESVNFFLSTVGPINAANAEDRLKSARALRLMGEQEREAHAKMSGEQAAYHLGRSEAFTEAALALLVEEEAA